MNLALITADWHIGSQDYDCTEYAINQVVDIADSQQVQQVWLLGDIFHKRRQESLFVKLARRAITRLAEHRKVLFVQGQHEKTLKTPWLSAICGSSATHAHKTSTLLNAKTVYGLDYEDAETLQIELEQVPADTDILLTHQPWKDFMGEDRGSAWFNQVPPAVSLIATGDLHQARIFDIGHGQAVSPGPIITQNWGETGQTFIYILREPNILEAIPLKGRIRCSYMDCRTMDDVRAALEDWEKAHDRGVCELPASIQKSALRIAYSDNIVGAFGEIQHCVGNRATVIVEPFSSSEASAGRSEEAAFRASVVLREGMEGCLRTFYRKDDDTSLQRRLRLWRAATTGDSTTVWNQIDQEFKAKGLE